MFNQIPATKALVTAFVCTTLSACGGSSSSPSTSVAQQNVTIQFAAKVGTQNIECKLMGYPLQRVLKILILSLKTYACTSLTSN